MPEKFDIEKNLRLYDVPLIGRMFRQRINKACEMGLKGIAIDIGCGRGYLADKRKDILSVDVSKKLILAKKRNETKDFVRCSADYLPFKNESFNCAFALDVLEHVPNCEKATEEIRRVIKKDGTLILSLPNENVFYRILAKPFRSVYGDPRDSHTYDYVRDVVSKSFDKIETNYLPRIPSFLKLWELCKYKPKSS